MIYKWAISAYLWPVDGCLVDGSAQIYEALGQRLDRGKSWQNVLLDNGLADNYWFGIGYLSIGIDRKRQRNIVN